MDEWGFHQYRKMLGVWQDFGPPAFLSLAVMNGHTPKSEGKPRSENKSTHAQDHGTMADLAARFGLTGNTKKVLL